MTEIKEKPILYSAPMILEILAGRKTQTRRVMKDYQQITPIPDDEELNKTYGYKFSAIPQTGRWGFCVTGKTEEEVIRQMIGYKSCPYGKKGDRLWVKENFKIRPKCYCNEPICDCEDYTVEYQADGASVDFTSWDSESEFPKRRSVIPSIHMNRHLSRITLEIMNIRIERLQDISNADILDEGITASSPYERMFEDDQPSLKRQWEYLWKSINGAESWAANQWVWVIEFKKI